MGQPYIGEIRMGGWTFVPNGWAACDGQPLQISEHDALFALIGTRYGGDGETTFNVPNLQSRFPMHTDNTQNQGEAAGVESVTLTVSQIPNHTHPLLGSVDVATSNAPDNNVLASITAAGTQRAYRSVPLDPFPTAPTSIAPVGGSQPHDNMHPYLVIRFIISLYGVFPSPT